MNAEEAKRCIDLAVQAIQVRNWAKAERMLVKSIRLNDTEQAQQLLRNLDRMKSQGPGRSSGAKPASPPSNRPPPPPPK